MATRSIKATDRVSGSVQTYGVFLSIENIHGGRTKYTVWSPVTPHYGNVPKNGAVYILQTGITPDSLDELQKRQSPEHSKLGFWSFRGRYEAYPYSEHYSGPVASDFTAFPTVELLPTRPQ